MHRNRPHHWQDCVKAQLRSLQCYLWCLAKVSVKHMFANYIWASQTERCSFQQYLSFPSLFQSYKISLHHIPPWTGAKQLIKLFPSDSSLSCSYLTEDTPQLNFFQCITEQAEKSSLLTCLQCVCFVYWDFGWAEITHSVMLTLASTKLRSGVVV